jgi:ABC-type glycerol-3-phosphate transport system substrate-binding protein
MTGWLESRLYGFSSEALSADGLLIYNKGLLNEAGAEIPGDMFDRGEWGFRDFQNYCAELVNKLPENEAVLDISIQDFLYNAVYANGGYVFHPETGQLMKDATAFNRTVALINELLAAGAFAGAGQSFERKAAAFVHGSPEDAKAYAEMGIDVGVVPYPWGPNIRLNRDFQTLDSMLSGYYRTSAREAGLFVLTRSSETSSALDKAQTADYVNIVFSYLGSTARLDTNAWRERTGLPPVNPDSRMDLTFLTDADRARLEWWRGRPAVFIPQERAETELREVLELLINYPE